MITAPFTKSQIKKLNEWQVTNRLHPYTCGGPAFQDKKDQKFCERFKKTGEGKLLATEKGWLCPCGKYKQHWAHDVD